MKHDPQLAIAFGQIIRLRRERVGLTQVELAKKVGASGSYLQFLEYGQRQPTLSTFLQLAEALDENPTELLQDTLRLMVSLCHSRESS